MNYRSLRYKQKQRTLIMPKTVDMYVLEEKIGSGQFGDVFKGYSKVDGTDVAVKSIRRDKIKGKFNDLLENEIQVLRSCCNNNIIRLIDIKKTANNIYLILEYCNQGDLLAYLKLRKRLTEDEALEFFVQILHAFQTLVKKKIMHRDFKLANVLRHDGVIKVADFGFSKLLGSEDQEVETILGSPLNMAPEILDNQLYNSKADIWSIGVAFYEMIFGKVPFSANNIIDLLKKIKKEPVSFPFKVNPQIQNVLKRMLTVDPVKRIEWNELFEHPVTRLLQRGIEDNLQKSLLCSKKELSLNMSKFYIKTNKVIENMNDIMMRKQLNLYVKKTIQTQEPGVYSGAIIKRTTQRANKENAVEKEEKNKQIKEKMELKTEKQIMNQLNQQGETTVLDEAHEKSEVALKRNFLIILHQRNLYAFLAHIAEDLIENNLNAYGECLSFLVLKKAMMHIARLSQALKKRNLANVCDWLQMESRPEYKQLLSFINSEEEVFNRFHEKLSIRVLETGVLSNFEEDLMISGRFTREQTNERMYVRVLKEYVERITKAKDVSPAVMGHLIKTVDTLHYEEEFPFGFDFSGYYQGLSSAGEEEITKRLALAKEKCLRELQ